MTITVKSNKFQNRHSLGIIRVLADAAGTGYVDVTPLFRLGQVNFGIQIQAQTSAITPSFTMADAETAVLPAFDTKVPWKTYAQLAASDIVIYPIGATVVKLVFAGAGEAFIGTL